MSMVAAARPLPEGAAPYPLSREHHPWLGAAVALLGAAVVLSPHVWADAWSITGVSVDYAAFYVSAWAPFGCSRCSPPGAG